MFLILLSMSSHIGSRWWEKSLLGRQVVKGLRLLHLYLAPSICLHHPLLLGAKRGAALLGSPSQAAPSMSHGPCLAQEEAEKHEQAASVDESWPWAG